MTRLSFCPSMSIICSNATSVLRSSESEEKSSVSSSVSPLFGFFFLLSCVASFNGLRLGLLGVLDFPVGLEVVEEAFALTSLDILAGTVNM